MIKTVLLSRRTLFVINFKEFSCLAFAFVRCILSSIVATRLDLAKSFRDHTTMVCYILTPRLTFLVSVYLLGCVFMYRNVTCVSLMISVIFTILQFYYSLFYKNDISLCSSSTVVQIEESDQHIFSPFHVLSFKT